jgi:hypothetical protein
LIIEDLEFCGENRRRMTRADALQKPYLVQQVDVCWLYQKNGTENKKKIFVCIGRGVDAILCGVSAWLRIVKWWAVLNLTKFTPLAVFTTSGLASFPPEFVRPTHINSAPCKAATAMYNITNQKELDRFSSHSIRVGACVALHAARISKFNIKFALRWKADSFYTYLRNLPCQAAEMAAAVLNFNPNRFTLVPAYQPSSLTNISLLSFCLLLNL